MAVIHARSGKPLLDTTEVLVIVPLYKPRGNSFKFDESAQDYRCPIRDKTVPVVYLQEGDGSRADTFDAHFCPFGGDEMHSIRVDSSCDYFFTADVTGCTLGFGPADPHDGSRLVSHANAMTVGTKIFDNLEGEPAQLVKARMIQQLVQSKMLQGIEPASSSLTPAAYGRSLSTREDIHATVMGFRDTKSNQWTFIRQSYDGANFVKRNW